LAITPAGVLALRRLLQSVEENGVAARQSHLACPLPSDDDVDGDQLPRAMGV
jgi:hypothetical protein